MRRILLVLAVPLSLGGCFSFSSSSPDRPASSTIIVPPGSTAVCANGTAPPC